MLLTFGTARWSIPLAAWLYRVFLLRFVRTQPARRGIALLVLAPIPVLGIAWHGFWGQYFPDALVALVVVLFVLLHALPYLADRVLVPRLGGVLGTLVFPLATTGWWYLFSLVSPWGTQLNPAHTQYGDLPLLQLLSVTGVWGLVFLMAWLASVVNWVWEQGFAWPRVRGGALLYAGLLTMVPAVWRNALGAAPPTGQHGADRWHQPITGTARVGDAWRLEAASRTWCDAR
jgi:apolipoprotein N-acyltransferase